jgi:hypothetical protein
LAASGRRMTDRREAGMAEILGDQDIHDQVSDMIDQDIPGYAQGEVYGHLVSLHPAGLYGRTMTTTSTFLSIRRACEGLLDGTVRGTARASRGTFTKKDYERRADYYDQDYLFASASEEDKAFALRLREFAAKL